MEKKFNQLFKNNSTLVYILSTVAIFLLSYGSVVTDYVINHDSVSRVYNGIHSIESGRFLRGPLNELLSFGSYSSMNAALLTYVFMLVGSIMLIKLFDIKSLFMKVLISAIVFTYPIFSFYWAYGNDIWQYSLAFSVSIISIYFVVKQGLKNKIISILLVVCMLAIYQSFLSTLTATFLLYYIVKFSKSEEVSVKEILINLLCLIIGATVYFIVLKVLLLVTNTNLTGYQHASSIGLVSIVTTIPYSLKLAYLDAANHVTANSRFFASDINFQIVYVLIYTVYPLLVVFTINSKAKKKQVAILISLLVLMPIFENSIFFVTNNIHHYSIFGYVITTIGALIIYNKLMPKSNWYFVIFIVYIYTSLFQVQQMLHFQEQQNNLHQQVATTIVTDLQKMPNYNENTEVVLCGHFDNENINFSEFSGIDFSSPLYNEGVNEYMFDETKAQNTSYLFRNMGYIINVVEGDCEQISQNQKHYPKDGYISGTKERMYVNY